MSVVRVVGSGMRCGTVLVLGWLGWIRLEAGVVLFRLLLFGDVQWGSGLRFSVLCGRVPG